MERLPLSALLSCALVAFVIEFDNEAEKRMEHRTARHGSRGGADAPWLASQAMWANCMQFVDETGITVRELIRRAQTKTNFAGMVRWGYITIEPETGDHRRLNKAEWIVRATEAGLRAREIWKPLGAEIERRWDERFGSELVDRLRGLLAEVSEGAGDRMPETMPILGYGLYSARPERLKRKAASPENMAVRGTRREDPRQVSLSGLLSRALLLFARDYEEEAEFSLAIGANTLRVLDQERVKQRELPHKSGVSKEGTAMALGILQKLGAIETGKDKGGARTARLTAKGRRARKLYFERVEEIEGRWEERFGKRKVQELKAALEEIAGDGTAVSSPLFKGLTPYADGWRAKERRMMLPHFPMVLHRGGYPDGS